MSSQESQRLLGDYLGASTPEEERRCLDALIVGTATPLVRSVIRRRFLTSRGTSVEDQEDTCGEAVAAIISRLRTLRNQPGSAEISSFESYSAGVAIHAANRFFQSRSPQRTLLRARIRYVLSTDKRFRLWRDEHGVWLCGVEPHIRTAATSKSKLPVVIHKALTAAGGIMELTEITSVAARELGITDRRDSPEDAAAALSSGQPRADHVAEQRQSIENLWREVCELPLPQRRALLLNLGSASASGHKAGVWLIPDLGVATFRQLASALGMSAEDLAEIWNDLPLSDNEIGARFALERQQVINLRSAARQRLARRLPI